MYNQESNSIIIDSYNGIFKYLNERNQSYKYFLYNYDNNLLNIDNDFYEKKLIEIINRRFFIEKNKKNIDNYLIYFKNIAHYIKLNSSFTEISEILLELRASLFEYSFKKYLELLIKLKLLKVDNEFIEDINDIKSLFFFKKHYRSLYCIHDMYEIGFDCIFSNLKENGIKWDEYPFYVYCPDFYNDMTCLCVNKGLVTVSVLDLINQIDKLCKILYIKLKNKKECILIYGNIYGNLDCFNFIENNTFYNFNDFIVEYNYYNNKSISHYISFKNNKLNISKVFEV